MMPMLRLTLPPHDGKTLELRFQRDDSRSEWELDEVVGRATVHIERLDTNVVWMSLRGDDGAEVVLHFWTPSRRSKLLMRAERDGRPETPLTAPPEAMDDHGEGAAPETPPEVESVAGKGNG